MSEGKEPKDGEILASACLFEGQDYVIGVRMKGESVLKEDAIGPVMSKGAIDAVCEWLNGGGKDALIKIGGNLEREPVWNVFDLSDMD